MSDEAIMNAIAKRVDLESKIAKAEDVIKRSKAQISEVNRFIKQWEKYSGRTLDDILSSKTSSSDSHSSKNVPVAEPNRNPKKEEVAEAVTTILEAAGRSLSRSEIFKSLQDQGITLYGANPEMVLSTMLWRTREAFGIIRLKSGGYTLLELLEDQDEVESEDGSDLI